MSFRSIVLNTDKILRGEEKCVLPFFVNSPITLLGIVYPRLIKSSIRQLFHLNRNVYVCVLLLLLLLFFNIRD